MKFIYIVRSNSRRRNLNIGREMGLRKFKPAWVIGAATNEQRVSSSAWLGETIYERSVGGVTEQRRFRRRKYVAGAAMVVRSRKSDNRFPLAYRVHTRVGKRRRKKSPRIRNPRPKVLARARLAPLAKQTQYAASVLSLRRSDVLRVNKKPYFRTYRRCNWRRRCYYRSSFTTVKNCHSNAISSKRLLAFKGKIKLLANRFGSDPSRFDYFEKQKWRMLPARIEDGPEPFT